MGGRSAAATLSSACRTVLAPGMTTDTASCIKIQRSADLAGALPNATYRSLPGRAHLPYLEAPDEIAALIMAEVI